MASHIPADTRSHNCLDLTHISFATAVTVTTVAKNEACCYTIDLVIQKAIISGNWCFFICFRWL